MVSVGSFGRRPAAYASCCLSILLTALIPASCLETEHQFGFVSVNNHVNTTVVTDCDQLREALQSEVDDNLIVVIAYIRCDPTVWDRTVVVYGNKTVTGPGHGVIVGAVDWGSGDGAVVVANGSSLTFQDIIILQDYLGANALLNLQFLAAGTESNAFLKGVAVGVGVCPQPVGIYDSDLRDLQRPGHIPGEQEADRLGVSGLFVRDVAFSPYGDSTWQQCNVIWRCGVTSALEPAFLEEFYGDLVSPVCGAPVAGGVETLGVGLRRRREEVLDSKEDKAAIGISLSVLGIFLVAMVVGAVLVFRRRSRRKRRKANELQRKIAGQHDFLQPMGGGPHPQDVVAPRELCNPHLGSTSPSGDVFPNVFKMELADVELGKRIKRGKSGSIYKCAYKGIPVAVKVVDHRGGGLSEDTGEPPEAELCRQLVHGNVMATYLYKTVRMDNVFAGMHTTWNRGSMAESRSGGSLVEAVNPAEALPNIAMDPKGFRTFIAMEYCNGGSLLKGINSGAFFTQETGPFEMRALLTALDIARGVCYLHDMCVVHGDLRPESCLVKSETSDKKGFVVKVGDFKLARYVADSQPLRAAAVGSTAYAAPELLKSGTLSKAADVYAMGMILWRLLSDMPAYKSMSEEEVVEGVLRGRRPEIPAHFSKGYRDLVEACWHQSRIRRPEFHQIVDRLQDLIAEAAARSGASSARPDGEGSPLAVAYQQTWELLTESVSGSRIYTPRFLSGEGSTSHCKPRLDPGAFVKWGGGKDSARADSGKDSARAGGGNDSARAGGGKDSAGAGGGAADLQRKSERLPPRGREAGGGAVAESSDVGVSTEREAGRTETSASEVSSPSPKRVCDSVADMPGADKRRFQEVDGLDLERLSGSDSAGSSRGRSSQGRSFLSRFLDSRPAGQGQRRGRDAGRHDPPRGSARGANAPQRMVSPLGKTTRGRFQVSIATVVGPQDAGRMPREAGGSPSERRRGSPGAGGAEPGAEARGSLDSGPTSSGTLPAELLPVPQEDDLAAPGVLLEVERPMTVSREEWDAASTPHTLNRPLSRS